MRASSSTSHPPVGGVGGVGVDGGGVGVGGGCVGVGVEGVGGGTGVGFAIPR